MALDVGVSSPWAGGAGADCCESTRIRKLRDYQDVLPELSASGVHYAPFPVSCFGRLHAESAHHLELLARAAARRRGLGDFRPLLLRARQCLSVQVWRRASSMVVACLRSDRDDLAVLAAGMDPPGAAVPGGQEVRSLVAL